MRLPANNHILVIGWNGDDVFGGRISFHESYGLMFYGFLSDDRLYGKSTQHPR